jgi:hypothetical protein
MAKQRYAHLMMLALVLLLLAACTSAPQMRRWQASPVLVQLQQAEVLDSWPQTLRILVYADGRVITSRYDYIEESQLSPAELCALLGEIESDGFFDFDPADYTPPLVFDGVTTHIEVNAWRSQSITASMLEEVLRGEIDGDVPAPIADTYERLKGFLSAKQTPYQAQRVVLFVTKSTLGDAAPGWPITTLSLGELSTTSDVVIEGEAAAELQALFGAERTKRYVEGETGYHVTLHRLLPLEIWQSGRILQRTVEFEDEPTRELACEL